MKPARPQDMLRNATFPLTLQDGRELLLEDVMHAAVQAELTERQDWPTLRRVDYSAGVRAWLLGATLDEVAEIWKSSADRADTALLWIVNIALGYSRWENRPSIVVVPPPCEEPRCTPKLGRTDEEVWNAMVSVALAWDAKKSARRQNHLEGVMARRNGAPLKDVGAIWGVSATRAQHVLCAVQRVAWMGLSDMKAPRLEIGRVVRMSLGFRLTS